MPAIRPRAKSNELYRTNLARGQTGLSVAFDLPTQTGYDCDHPLAKGEVGKVGVPISHLGDMRTLFDGIPLDRMNTSMTINAPAAWLLSLYIAAGRSSRASSAPSCRARRRTTSSRNISSRGTYIFPPEPSLRLTADTIGFTYREVPKWNPMNVCSYHLQEAGATPVQELAFSLANAIAVLDAVRARGQVPEADFPQVVGRISFFVNAGIRFVTEMCKMRAFAELWDDITLQPLRRRRRQAAPVPLRRAGELAGPDRAAAGEQRLPHPARDAGRGDEQERPRPLGAAAGLERGARPAAPVGPAMVAAPAADRGLRDRPAGIWRHLRRQRRDRAARSRS